MALNYPSARTLYNSQTAPGPGSISANSNSGNIDLRDVCDVALSVTVDAPTGTTPSLTVQLDMLDACGNWIPAVVKTAAITAAGTVVVHGGLHGATPIVLTATGRISWAVTGTTPNFPGVAISLVGR